MNKLQGLIYGAEQIINEPGMEKYADHVGTMVKVGWVRDVYAFLKEQPQWILASERMPKYECYGRKYWVYTQYKKPNGEVGGRQVQLLRWEQTTIRGKTVERFKTLWDGVVYDEVIAWMPLKEPEPPMMG